MCDSGGFSLNFNPQFNPGCCSALMKSASPPPPPAAARRRSLTERPGGDGGRWAQKMSEEMSSRGPSSRAVQGRPHATAHVRGGSRRQCDDCRVWSKTSAIIMYDAQISVTFHLPRSQYILEEYKTGCRAAELRVESASLPPAGGDILG